MIGRFIKVLEGSPRLVISIFHPAIGGDPVEGIDLYAPCQAEAAKLLTEMGVDLDNLNVASVTTGGALAPKTEGYPVILFSPGFGVECDMYLGVISKLVAKNYVVVTISAPRESVFTVFPDGSYLKQAPEMAELASSDYPSWSRLLHNRIQFIHAVMDVLEMLNRSDDAELAGLFDLAKVAVMGHSLGGAAALEAAKQDHRIKAAVLLDPSFHLLRREDVQSSVPVLLLRQEASAYREMAASMNETIASDYIDGQRYAFNSLNNAHFYRVKGAQHMSFSDIPLHYGDQHTVPVHAVTAEAATAFMKAVFDKGALPPNAASQLSEAVISINSEGEPAET
ncbi:carboxylic ester hydrolase [Paenibacillus sp. FSL R7-269]|uniref:alpha/beta hydrolase family protein n=1 Tax=Paenibacillus sp. FSL R7-269 TaxID=1226755 RepID=UPI0003E1D851|nr:alpha/beta fold hydrolase [Paenibacillus sp. FSL R7-269]ETT44686.1 carboxylic ester hydrolase [Paenibacillus sp. FSL R7-269]